MTNERQRQIDEVEHRFYREVYKKLDIDINPGSSISSSEPNGWSNFKFRLPDQMDLLKSTKYYSPETKLLHFTSIEALLSIINDSSIRLYNLWNSNDEQEYELAAKIFDQIYEIIDLNGEGKIKLAKTYSFISSFTRSENYLSTYHWRNFGNDFKGVAIEFEVNPDYKSWYKFILSRTFYDKLADFDALFNAWRDFQLSTPRNKKFDIEMNWLLSLYKDKSFLSEDEIRLYLYSDGHKDLYPIFFEKYTNSTLKTGSSNLGIKYFRLPLCNDFWNFNNPCYKEEEVDFWKRIPKLRISKIYFGPNLLIEDWKAFNSLVRKSIMEKTGRKLNPKDLQQVKIEGQLVTNKT